MYQNSTSLYDRKGQRKYLNQKERLRFLEVTKQHSVEVRLFCQLLYYTGARIAEIHNLTPTNIDVSNETVIIETLKRRRRGVFREIPLPVYLINDLKEFIDGFEQSDKEQLWSFSIRTASRIIKTSMDEANIKGAQSSARGLRHGFAVHAITKAPLTLVKKWLGHASLRTTEIYLNILGEEEREIAGSLWCV